MSSPASNCKILYLEGILPLHGIQISLTHLPEFPKSVVSQPWLIDLPGSFSEPVSFPGHGFLNAL